MFPVALNLANLPILLLGEGVAFEKRNSQLIEAGAKYLTCHSRAGASLKTIDADLDSCLRGNDKVVMIVGLDYSTSEIIANEARKRGKLVNVEDVPELCDFYFMSQVRRGDLTIAISTNGASPTLAKRLRDYLSARFGEEWAGFVEEIKQHRNTARAGGASMAAVVESSDQFINEKNWLDCNRCPQKGKL